MTVDQIYTCTCICNLQSLCRSLYEYFYSVILTPKKNRIIIYSLSIIIEKDYNYNAISIVSDGKAHSVLAIESDSEYLKVPIAAI